MKRIFVLATLLLCMLTATTTFAASKDSVVEQRRQVDQLSAKVLEKLYETYPHAQRVIEECYAYATLSNSDVEVLFVGSSHGRGLAYNNQTGEKVYLRMEELSAGLGIGAKEYNLIFLINTRDAWENFIAGKTRFGASAEASADDGINGGSIEGAEYVAPGVWVFQMTTKGLELEATLKGTKIYKDKKLNG
ncbi:MAG: hypothetical protein IJQ82_12930 [Selenomonadaceae bacterium]|nr:hypothetical protein [Selenomonadaceae bacterium]